METAFTYQEQLLPHQIRILIVRSACDSDADILCDVQVAERSKTSGYTALSYSWAMSDDGDASPCRSIFISGRRLNVTRNLCEGLRRLRRPHAGLRVWVDAVCINQQDIAERNAQVAAMAEVYACATQVIVWLGEGRSEQEDAAAFTVLAYLSSRNDHDASSYHSRFVVSNVEVDIADVHRWATEDVSKSTKAVRLEYDRHLRDSITAIARVTDALLGRRWFSRRWIVQEVVIPHNSRVKVYWGSHSLPFGKIVGNEIHGLFKHEFRKTFDLLPTTNMSDTELKEHDRTDFLLARVRRLSQRCTNLSRMQSESGPFANKLTSALWIYSRQDCSDPRDRVYALLSLAPSCTITPNYNLSTAELYISFARYLVTEGLIGMLLASFGGLTAHDPFLGESEIELDSLSLPSWVPDLRLPFSGGSLSSQSISASVNENTVLVCEMSYVGCIESSSAGLEIVGDPTADVKIGLPVTLCNLILPGDVACLASVSESGIIVVLRKADDTSNHYHIVRTMDPWGIPAFQYGRRVPRTTPASLYHIL